MSSPVYNPIVPFNMNLSLNVGKMIIISGKPIGARFSINLTSGPGDHTDNVFHFNPRFDDGNTVIRNTKHHGNWQAEERQSSGFPFMMHQPFEIIILCQKNQYKVAVNGKHFIEYRHRLGMGTVRNLSIKDAVQISMIRFDQEAGPKYPGNSLPSSNYFTVQDTNCRPSQTIIRIQRSEPTIVNNPTIPYIGAIPFNNMKGRRVTISGIPQNHHPHRIMINFLTAEKNNFFHFNPRLNERVIVRNAKQFNNWGPEDRGLSVPFPFQYGVPYQLVISVDQACFRVEMNGMLICTFAHRQRPLNLIRHLNIEGSTSISRIAYN